MSQAEFDQAIADLRDQPRNLDTWERVEELATSLDAPDEAAEAFREAVASVDDSQQASELGRRAVEFHEQWFGAECEFIPEILRHVLRVSAQDEWAFERITVALTMAENWADLFGLYDEALASRSEEDRLPILEEAYQTAKDLANDGDRALTYLAALHRAAPTAKRAALLEKQLTKSQRWAELIELWETKLSDQSPEKARDTQLKIARTWLEANNADAALPYLTRLADQDSQPAETWKLLEDVLAADTASASTRADARDHLVAYYDANSSPREAIRILESAEGEEGVDHAARQRSIAERLGALGDTGAAQQFADLFLADPSSDDLREKLRTTASSDPQLLARTLGQAASKVDDTARKIDLLREGAAIWLEQAQREAAIELLLEASRTDGIETKDALDVGRQLNELLDRSDRHEERLEVLERLVLAETVPSTQRALIGDIANVAEKTGEIDRALDAWARRLELDSEDLPALNAMIALLEREGRSGALIDALRRRAATSQDPTLQRADLTRVAHVYEKELGSPAQAIDAWLEIVERFGDTEDAVIALADLLTREERWDQLAELLERVNTAGVERLADRLVELGAAYSEHLGSSDRACTAFARCLAVAPSNEAATAGLTALLDNDEHQKAAADALARAAMATENWEAFLALTNTRLSSAASDADRLAVLVEGADIYESKVGDPPKALEMLCQAFPLDPTDRGLEERIGRLGRQTGLWTDVVTSYEAACGAVEGSDPRTFTRLKFRQARLQEEELDRLDDAFGAFIAVIELEPNHLPATAATIRLGSHQRNWRAATLAVCRFSEATGTVEESLMSQLDTAAGESEQYDPLCEALEQAMSDCQLGNRQAADILWWLATWHNRRDGEEDSLRVLKRLVELDPRRAPAVHALADLQRGNADNDFANTLQLLCDLEPENLAHFRDAAEVSQALGLDAETALGTLFARASTAWRAGSEEAQEQAQWALDQLIEHHSERGNHRRSLDLLMEASRLPFDADAQHQLKLRAAQIANDSGNTESAIEAYRSVLVRRPEDSQAVEQLDGLFRKLERLPELLALKRHQLSLKPSVDERLSLRLEVVAILGDIEERFGSAKALLENLEEEPGHAESLGAITRLYEQNGRFKDLLETLTGQAAKLEERAETERAADIWAHAATVAEQQADSMQAFDAHKRVVDLTQSTTSLDALARICMQDNRMIEAVQWLERRLQQSDESDKPRIAARLARAHIGSERPERATVVLEKAVAQGYHDLACKKLLANLYRGSNDWEHLAELLTRSLDEADDALALSWAREAAEIYHDQLKTPAKALPALEKALAFEPENNQLRLQQALGLRVAGDTSQARTVLEGLIAQFGRRRSPERARVHVELAEVAKAEDCLDEAVSELELASRMNTKDRQTLRNLASTAREASQHDLAEKTLRALLLQVRRDPGADDEMGVGPAEVFYEMHLIATAKDDEDKARETLDSCKETAVHSETEARRIRRVLLAHGQHQLLAEILRERLEHTEGEAKARVLADLAGVLHTLGDPAGALQARFEAATLAPAQLDNVRRARGLAKELDDAERFVDEISAVAEKLRRDEEQETAGELAMILGDAAEEDLGDTDRAREFYSLAESHRAHRVQALFALARTSSEGDEEEQLRALEELREFALEDESPSRRADALYKVADLELTATQYMERGLETLDRASRIEPRYTEAAEILKRAADAWEDHEQILSAYEHVARASRDKELLLDFLERQCASANSTFEQQKEAVQLTVELECPARGEALLVRAVEAARASAGGVASAGWALSRLIDIKTKSGDTQTAFALLHDLAEFEEWPRVQELGGEIAVRAAEVESSQGLAADAYEFLLERDRQQRLFWEPLFGLYEALDMPEKLHGLIMKTLPVLVDVEDRNAMRRRGAAFFLGQDKVNEAKDLLRNALQDNADDNRAAIALESILREEEDMEGLASFLSDRYEDAKQRGEPEAIADVAVQYGGLLADSDRDAALSVFREALDDSPNHLGLLRAALQLTDKTEQAELWADLMERRLGVEEEAQVPGLALELAAQREEHGDIHGTRRALELGNARNGTHQILRKCLKDYYRDRELWGSLAEMTVREAELVGEAEAVGLLQQAAELYQSQLEDHGNAATALARAIELAPADVQLVSELARAHTAANNAGAAIEALSEALARDFEDIARRDLLLHRSDLFQSVGQGDEAVNDLEAAFELDPDAVQPLLFDGLEKRRVQAREQSDEAAEREATLRLVAMNRKMDAEAAARDLLFSWIDRSPNDRDALVELRDMDTEAEAWDGVITACGRLALIDEGDDQVDAALRVYKAAEQIEAPEQARAALEHVVRVQPHRQIAREYLRHVYEACDLRRELAELLLVEAEHTEDADAQYECYRGAADIFVNELVDAEAALPAADKARQLRPDDHETTLLFADVLTASNKTDEALELLEPAIQAHKRRSPQLASLQYRMSRVHGVIGDRDTQLYWLKKAFDVDRKDGVIAAELAQLATDVGDFDLALKPLRAITLMDSPGPVTRVMALLWEAKIEHARGNRAKAELWAKKALREDPTYQEAAEFLEQISE